MQANGRPNICGRRRLETFVVQFADRTTLSSNFPCRMLNFVTELTYNLLDPCIRLGII